MSESAFAWRTPVMRTVALEVDVVYTARLTRMAMIETGDECRFEQAWQVEYLQNLPRLKDGQIDHVALERQSEERSHKGYEINEGVRLDPYKVMEAFELLKSPDELLALLNGAGLFWGLGSLTWSQFLEWQRFVRCVRNPNFPENAVKPGYPAEAIKAVRGFPNKCFPASAWIEDDFIRQQRSRFAETNPEQPDPFATAKAFREEELRRLAMCFHQPSPKMIEFNFLLSATMFPTPDEMTERSQEQRSVAGKRRVQKTESKLKTLSKVSWFPEAYIAEYNLKPVMVVKASNILEAIAAAIWADRHHGIKYARCEGCQRLFNKESEHGQKYCSDTCKNVVTQRKWRERQRVAKDMAAQRKGKPKRAKKADLAK